METRASLDLAKKWLDFSTPDLSGLPLEFQVFLSHLNRNVAFEIDALSKTPPPRTLAPLTLRRPPAPSPKIAVPVKKENEQHQKLKRILESVFLGEKIEHSDVRPGVARFKIKRGTQIRVIEYSNLIKPVTPEQVRGFFTDAISKSKASSGILISSSEITGAKLIDIFGVSVSGGHQAPVIVISSATTDQERLANLVKLANDILEFLQRINVEVEKFTEEHVSTVFGSMPHILHSVSALLGFVRANGWSMRNPVNDGQTKKGTLPEYRALSITGGGFVMSRPEGGTITSRTIVRPATVGRRTTVIVDRNVSVPAGASVRRTVRARPVLTEQTFISHEVHTVTRSRIPL